MNIAICSLDNSEKILAGGKHVHQNHLKKAFTEQGHHVQCFFPERSLKYLLIKTLFFICNKLRLINKAFAYKWTLLQMKKSIQTQLSQQTTNFDILFAQDPVSLLASVEYAKRHNSGLIMTLHGYLSLESVNYGNFNLKERNAVLSDTLKYENESLNYTEKVITVDSKIANYLREKFAYKGNIIVLPNAIDPDPFMINSKHSLEDLDIFDAKDRQILLVPRRLVKKNGVHVAIDALKILQDRGIDNYYLVIMGDGPEKNNLVMKAQSLKLKSYIFIGSKNHEQAINYYKVADIVLVPSVISDGVEEATSLSMLEGMAAQKIVITSNIGGMKEVMIHQGNGFTFEQNNPQELADLILEVSKIDDSKVNEIKKNAVNLVLEKHHYKVHAEKYLSVASKIP